MDPTGLHVFLALVEGRTDAEVEHVLAVGAATAHHIDQHKETEMKRFPFKLTEFLQESDHERYQAAVAEDNAKREAEARAWQQAEREAKAARKQGR